MERILIIGGNGAGKTTFAKALAEKTQLPLVHLDALYWRDGWQPVPDEEFDRLLLQELQKPRWILDGNIRRTLPLRLQYCDTVLYFDFSRLACLWGVVKRSLTHWGRTRPDLGGNCPEGLHFRFWKSVWTGHQRGRDSLYQMLEGTHGVNVILLKNRREAKKFLQGSS